MDRCNHCGGKRCAKGCTAKLKLKTGPKPTVPVPLLEQTEPLCRHCGQHPIARPRRLCWGCYYRPGVRDLYPNPNEQRYGNGVGLAHVRDCLPTTALPGTPEKLAVFQFRAANRQRLFHPMDATA